MITNHRISDLTARINNAVSKNKYDLLVPNTKITRKILDVLEEEGFIRGYQLKDFNSLIINLKYYKNKSVINSLSVVSKPSKRVYFSKEEIIQWKNENNKFSLLLISTNMGIFTHKDDLNWKIGGEVLISIS
jgi:small subunit ribosomal protein S8